MLLLPNPLELQDHKDFKKACVHYKMTLHEVKFDRERYPRKMTKIYKCDSCPYKISHTKDIMKAEEEDD